MVQFRASGVLNLASGAIGALEPMLAWQLQQGRWADPLTWVPAILATTVLWLFYGRCIAPGMAWRDPVVRAVASLGFALVVRRGYRLLFARG